MKTLPKKLVFCQPYCIDYKVDWNASTDESTLLISSELHDVYAVAQLNIEQPQCYLLG